MAVAFKALLGTGVSTSSGTTVTVTTTAAIDIGDLVVVRVASDNLSATTPTFTCADGGNTYTNQRQGAVNATAAAGVAGAILTTKATVARPSGSTITVTLSGAVAHKAVLVESFTGVENTVRSAAVSATGASTTGISPASGTVVAGDLVLGFVAWETRGALTGDADTGGGTWSGMSRVPSSTSGSDATNVQAGGQYKIPNSAAAQTYNITGSSAEWLCGVLVLQASLEPSITQAAYQFFDEAGTESGATVLAAQNTLVTGNLSVGDGYGMLRVRLQVTANSGFSSDDYQLQYELNASGSWVNVGTGSVLMYDAPQLTDGQATTSRLTGGTGTFVPGKVSELGSSGIVSNLAITTTNYTELVYSLWLPAAGLANGDTVRFRVLRNGVTTGMTYTQTPTINIISTPPQVWSGSISTVGFEGVSDEFIYEAPAVPQTWDGSIATVGLDGISDIFVGGEVTWVSSSISTLGVLGVTDIWAVVGPPQDWGGTPVLPTLPVTTGLLVSYDASMLALADGASVTTWPDLSGNGRNLVPGGGSPTFQTDELNGLGVVRFDGVNHWMQIASGAGVTYKHFLFVAKFDLATFSDYNGLISGDAELGLVGNVGSAAWYPPQVGGSEYRKSGAVDAGRSGPMTAWAHMGLSTTAGLLTARLQIGLDRSFAPRYWDGDIAEIIGYDRVLSDAERIQVEDYLQAKWFEAPVIGADVATIGISGVSGEFVLGAAPPQTWIGSTATAGVAGVSDVFTGGTVIWAGSIAIIGVASVTGVFIGGATTWIGSTALVGVSALTGDFVLGAAPPQTWIGSTATVGITALTDVFVPGSTIWVGNTATVGVTGASGVFSPGVVTWVGSIVSIGVATSSGAFTPSAVVWTGSTSTIGVAGTSGVFVGAPITWIGSTSTVGVNGVSGLFVAGGQGWVGSIASVGVNTTSGTFIGGSTTWITTSAARIGVAGTTSTFTGGATTWVSAFTARIGIAGTTSTMLPGIAVWIGSVSSIGVSGMSVVWTMGGKPKVWDGSKWEDKPVKVWNGSAWIEKPMKRWTGSEWKLV